jgi:hypothetical protein
VIKVEQDGEPVDDAVFAEHLLRSAAEIVYQQVEDSYRQPPPRQAMLLLLGSDPPVREKEKCLTRLEN